MYICILLLELKTEVSKYTYMILHDSSQIPIGYECQRGTSLNGQRIGNEISYIGFNLTYLCYLCVVQESPSRVTLVRRPLAALTNFAGRGRSNNKNKLELLKATSLHRQNRRESGKKN